jgi:Lar family restriction alleviation protein
MKIEKLKIGIPSNPGYDIYGTPNNYTLLEKINELIDAFNINDDLSTYNSHALNNHADRLDRLESLENIFTADKSLSIKQEKEPELLPCPFCCGLPISHGYQEIPGALTSWIVKCAECHCKGPLSKTKQEAISAWNKRA